MITVLDLLLAAMAPEPAGHTTSDLVVAVLGVGGISAVLAAVVTGLFSKRKLGAEATDIITKAAAGVVTTLREELARSVAQMALMEQQHERAMARMAADHAAERADVQRVLQLHVAWDAIAIAKMAEIGVDLPEAPPLLPALRHVDERGYSLGARDEG